jgi:hypothetical protein
MAIDGARGLRLADFYGADDDAADLLLTSGDSTTKLRQTIIRKFNKWLIKIGATDYATFDTLTIEEINKDLFSRFADHLSQEHSHIALDSCLSYLSHFKMVIMEKFVDLTIFGNDKWYTLLRTNIVKRYFARDTEDGGNQPSMAEDDVAYVLTLILNKDLNAATR